MRLTQRRYSIVQWSASASNTSDFDERPVSKSMSTSDPGGLLDIGGLPPAGSVIGTIG
jgi:hypothetical protein